VSAWRWSVGSGSSKVTALELPHRRNGLYLRWRARGNWAVQSLQLTCRTATGRLTKAACEAAQAATRAKSRELAEAAAALPVPGEPVTLAQAEALAFHPDRGRWTKGGTTVQLTGGQLVAVINALHGYLHRLEGLSPVEGMSLEQGSNVCDYPLFPQGPLPGGRKGHGVADPERHMRVNPVNRRWVLAQFRRAEARAGVPHVSRRLRPPIVSDFRPLRKQTRKH